MSEEKEPNQIEEIINALDFNLKNLEDAKGMTMAEVKWFLLDILGTVRDMWERLQGFFVEMDKVKKIEEARKKGEKHMEEIPEDNTDIKNLYI